MGQYYHPIVMTEAGGKVLGNFYSWDYGTGLKLMESSYVKNPLVRAVTSFLMSQGNPCTLVWLGDYAELNEDVAPEQRFAGGNRDYQRMFLRAQRAYDRKLHIIKPDDPDAVENLGDADNAVFYNTVTHEKIDLNKYRAAQVERRLKLNIQCYNDDALRFIIHPIPLLTCLGNGKGGGDFLRGNRLEAVGLWALHPIIVLPVGHPDPKGEWEDASEKYLFEEE